MPPKGMSISKQDQFRHENKTWERLFDFFKQENILLKHRLSEVVDSEESKELLKHAENFQSKFILNDGFIDDLKKEVLNHEKYINNDLKDDLLIKISKKQEVLRNEIANFEKKFSTVKNEFNEVLSDYLVFAK